MDKTGVKKVLGWCLEKFALRPSILEVAMTVFGLLAVIYCLSILSYIFFLILAYGGALLALLWLLHGLVALFTLKKVKKRTPRQWAAWTVLPVAIALALIAVKGRYQLVGARIWLGENALQEFVDNLPKGQEGVLSSKDSWVGLFLIEEAVHDDGCIRMKVDEAGFIGPAGIAYSPDIEPENGGLYSYTHIYGPWYTWVMID